MTARRPCPPAPGPLEDYAARFDDLFFNLTQRRGFREYLTELLAPRERNKTITCLAGAQPVAGAGMPGVQRLQFFLSESPWEAEQVNDRRLELLREQPATAPHDGGVIVIDDSGDRKDGTKTAHVGRRWLGRYGKTDNGIVTVTTVWTDGRLYYPLHANPYTPAHHFARGRTDPAFRTKPQLAAALAARGAGLGVGQYILAVPGEPGRPDKGPAHMHGELRVHLPVGQLNQALPGRALHRLEMVRAQHAEQHPAVFGDLLMVAQGPQRLEKGLPAVHAAFPRFAAAGCW